MLLTSFMSSSQSFVAGLALGLALTLGGPGVCHAQTDDERAGARAAAAEGIRNYDAGHYAEAYDLLNRAESLVHAPTHLLYMARSAAKLGHLVQAREIYIKIGQEQLVAAAPRAFVDAQTAAVQEQRAVEARLAFLTVTVEGATSDVKVSIDSRVIPGVLVGVPLPVDPGTHTLVATAGSGAQSDPATVTLTEGQRDRITLKINAAGAAAVPAPVANPATGAPTTAAASSTSSPPVLAGTDKGTQESSGKPPVLTWVSLGVGAVGVGLGTVFLVQHSSKASDATTAFNACNARGCTRSEHDNVTSLDQSSARAGTLSWVSYGVGAAAITTGLYLLFSSNSKADAPRGSAQVIPYVGPRSVGATLSF